MKNITWVVAFFLIIWQPCMVKGFVGPTVELVTKLLLDCVVKSFPIRIPANESCAGGLDEYTGCWLKTPRNKTATIKCPFLTHYQNENYFRFCQANGKWADVDLSRCTDLPSDIKTDRRYELLLKYNLSTTKEIEKSEERSNAVDNQKTLLLVLRYIDASLCFLAFILLLALIPLKNPRIFLHRNLLVAFFFRDICEIIYLESDLRDQLTACNILTTISYFFFIAQNTWMFNEGFFQFRQFYFVFITKKYTWVYFAFGWLFPALFAFAAFYPAMEYNPPQIKSCWKDHNTYRLTYLIYGPVLILLVLNLSILIFLMWTIWSKLKATPNVANKDLHRSRKAARGFAILVTLLGGGFALTFYGPVPYIPFKYIRTVVAATQGLLVCIFYIFMSREVHEAFRRKRGRWNNSRHLSKSRTESSDFPSSRRTSLFQLPRRLSTISRDSYINGNADGKRRNSDDALSKSVEMENRGYQNDGDIKLHPIEEMDHDEAKFERNEMNSSASNNNTPTASKPPLEVYENLPFESNKHLHLNGNEIDPKYGELRDIITAYADRRTNENDEYDNFNF